MSTENNAGGGTTPPAAPAPAAPAADPTDAEVRLTSSKLKERLDQTRESAREAFLKELGLSSLAEGKKFLADFKQLQQAQLSEQEKLQQRVKELEPFIEKSTKAEARYAAIVKKQFDALPEAVRTAIEEQLGENATTEQRESLMAFYAKVGATPGAAGAVDTNNTTKPANAGATTPAPRPAAVKSKYDEWADLEKRDPFGASIFFQTHSREIERTKPA